MAKTLKEFLHHLADHVGAGSLHTEIDELEEPKQERVTQHSDSPTSDPDGWLYTANSSKLANGKSANPADNDSTESTERKDRKDRGEATPDANC